MSTQHLEEAEVLADNLALMDSGKLVCKGSPDEIKKKYGVGYNLILNAKPENFNKHKQDLDEIT